MNLFDDHEVQRFMDWLDEGFRQTAMDVVEELKQRGLKVDSWDSLYNLVHSHFYRDELAKAPLILNANIQSTL